MIPYPNIDPVLLQVGPIAIHWYGVSYLVGFASAWFLGEKRAGRINLNWNSEQVSDLIFYVALGAVLGGRLGYILFYDFAFYLAEPSRILRVWEGGMSFHGGMLGSIMAMLLFAKATEKSFFQVADFAAPLVPLGIFFGRIANFINSELWGKETDMPWGVVFPNGGVLPRHPSQLYEAVLEGVFLFILLWVFSSKPRPMMAVSALFLIGYSLSRFVVEFFRVPDAQLGYLAWEWLTMGQLLSLPMLMAGCAMMFYTYSKQRGKNETIS